MSVECRAGETGRKRRQIKPPERKLRGTGCGNGRGNDSRKGRHATNTGFEAKSAVALVPGSRSLGKINVANNATASAIHCLSRGLGRTEACDQTRERNRVSGDERDNAPS